jgi:hypothetical protein
VKCRSMLACPETGCYEARLEPRPVGAQVFVVLHFDEFRVRAPAPYEEVRRVPARPYVVAKCQSNRLGVLDKLVRPERLLRGLRPLVLRFAPDRRRCAPASNLAGRPSCRRPPGS